MRKVYTTHGNPFVTHHKASTDRSVPFGRSEGPDGYASTPGSPFVDVWGEEGGVFVSNDTDLGSIIYEFISGQEEAGRHVSEVMGRSWKSSDDTLAVSWEVDAKTLYVAGTGYDVSAQIAGDIFACALQSETTAVIVHRLDEDDYAITTLALSNGENGSFVRSVFSITITDPVLFIGFGATAGSFFTVTTPDTGSVIARWTYNVPVWTAQALTTLTPLTVTSDFSYSKELDVYLPTSIDVSGQGTFSNTFKHGENIQSDTVRLVGERIIACSTDGDMLSLLVQRYDGNNTRTTNYPRYSYSEMIGVFVNAIIFMGFFMGWKYNWRYYMSAYDSGKLPRAESISSTSAFDQIDITATTLDTQIIRTNNVLPSGSFAFTSSGYTREASHLYDFSAADQLSVIPYQDIRASRSIYTEYWVGYERTWSNAIKLYCADPAKGVYVYQRFNASMWHKYMDYNVTGFASPDPADVANTGKSYTGTIDTVLMANGVETVLHTRPFEEELGTSFANRYDMNWKPTMPFYTQPQGPYRNKNADGHGDWTNSENKTINKSVNLAFKGRYIDSDSDKTLAGWNYSEHIENDLSPDLNFEEFEDINKLKYNLTWNESYQPKAWQLIKGWGQFTRRAGFKTVEASGAAFVDTLSVTPVPAKTLPISLRMAE